MKIRDQKYATIVIKNFPGETYYDVLGIEAAYCRMGIGNYCGMLIEVLASKPELLAQARKEVRALFENKKDERNELRTKPKKN